MEMFVNNSLNLHTHQIVYIEDDSHIVLHKKKLETQQITFPPDDTNNRKCPTTAGNDINNANKKCKRHKHQTAHDLNDK